MRRGSTLQPFPIRPSTPCTALPGDFPSGKKGDVLTVQFTVIGIPCLGLNGGPMFKHNEAFSFQVATADQAETDRYWNAIVGNGGRDLKRERFVVLEHRPSVEAEARDADHRKLHGQHVSFLAQRKVSRSGAVHGVDGRSSVAA